MTLRQATIAAAARFATDPHLHQDAARDADLLLLHTLHITRAALVAYPDRELTQDEQSRYEDYLDRRLRHEPIQYITGQQEFYGLAFHVTPAVLIPRPETEHLVEAALELLPANQPLKIADVGTGSGAIAIALAVHLPLAQIVALDISTPALAVASTNARSHNVADRITFLESNLLSNLSGSSNFDAIISNPPYIPDSDRSTLHPQVRNHEPATALFAGHTGLDIYRRLIPQAAVALKANGLLAMEIGYGQEPAVSDLLADWQNLSFIRDLQEIPRVALARRPTSSKDSR